MLFEYILKFTEKFIFTSFIILKNKNFSGQKQKKSLEPFLRKISKCPILG